MKAKNKFKRLILDGGGSSLKAFVETESGWKLKAKYKGNFNVQSGNREMILRAISEAMRRFPSQQVQIGLAGLIAKKDKDWLVSSLVGKKIKAMSDADLAFVRHFQNGDGMLAILGTGSMFVAKSGRKKIKIGGYGRLIGDAGSGYAIGREAARDYLRLLDGFMSDPAFEARMKKVFRDKEDAVRKIYQERFDLQHLAPVVFECAAQGSTIANDIIDHQTSLVARYIEQLRRQIGRELPLRVVGGLMERETRYSMRLKEKLRHLNINVQFDNGSS